MDATQPTLAVPAVRPRHRVVRAGYLLLGLLMSNLLKPGDNLGLPLPDIGASANLATSKFTLKDFVKADQYPDASKDDQGRPCDIELIPKPAFAEFIENNCPLHPDNCRFDDLPILQPK